MRTRHAATFLAATLALALTATAVAQSGLSTADDTKKKAIGQLADAFDRSRDLGPFRLTAGPTDDGNFGTALKGEKQSAVDVLSQTAENLLAAKPGLVAAYQTSVGYGIDASWKSSADAANNASLYLKPRLSWLLSNNAVDWSDPKAIQAAMPTPAQMKKCRELAEQGGVLDFAKCGEPPLPDPRLFLAPFGDLRYRYGTFKSGTTLARANQGIIGAGIGLVPVTPQSWSWIDQWPSIDIAYEKVVSTKDSTIPVPDDIKADFINVGFSTRIGLGPVRQDAKNGDNFWVKLYIEESVSKSTSGSDRSWQDKTKLQLVVYTNSELKPAITYENGKEGGLKYDKQLILGVLWQLVGS